MAKLDQKSDFRIQVRGIEGNSAREFLKPEYHDKLVEILRLNEVEEDVLEKVELFGKLLEVVL